MAAHAQPSTCAAPLRRFIYLILNGGNDSHTLHRIDTSPLFAAGVRAQQGPRRRRPPPPAALPSPLARFDCASGRQFLPLGRGVEKIVSVDGNRHTIIFDTRTESVRAGPDACYVKWHGWGSTWAEAGGRLYHLGRGPGHEEQMCLDFEVLTYDHHREDWFWNILPSPPFRRYMNVTIESFADARAGEAGAGAASEIIRISGCNRTYSFDAAHASWRKEGEWVLPFRERAQYVADYGMWFGFTNDLESNLCAADLNVPGRPVRRHVWANVDGRANHNDSSWLLNFSYLSYLGSGRFCVTRFIRETDYDDRPTMTAVVTAVEASRTASSSTGEIQMVRRASMRYRSPVCDLSCSAYAY